MRTRLLNRGRSLPEPSLYNISAQKAECEKLPTVNIPTSYSEIKPRKCRLCGRRTRDLAAVLTPRGWSEWCFRCRQLALGIAGSLPRAPAER